ncbi:cyclin-K-like [Patiria miniata]|uniref:Cyclin-like domain-containing protein n=1 Tax=Patiria miniata TaxID=46514 RepID=A0A914BGM9_PATMI|nr:cyclin-K-like [Patiria miniata]XP_038075057.1 cyclin-K-like [Patiria miniata]
MPCWYYEKEDLVDTPSRRDSIDAATEARYRKEGARFIIDAGTSQGLRYDTMATGVVYFHRFYMFHSFKDFPRFVTGAACLFLAGKVEETPKKCKDIIRVAKLMVPEPHFSTFGDDPKEEIMTYERILLQTIKFDLQVDHPYSYLLKYAKTLKGDKAKIQQLVQMAWTFVNDSLCTTLCLQWEPHIVGVAFLYLAGRLSKSDLLEWSGKNTKVKWWEQLADDVSLDIMEDICHLLLDLYSTGKEPKPSVLTPTKAAVKRPRPKTPPVAGAESSKSSDDSHGSQQSASKPEKPRDGHSYTQSRPPPPPLPSSSSSGASTSGHSQAKGTDQVDKSSSAKAHPPPPRKIMKESAPAVSQPKAHAAPPPAPALVTQSVPPSSQSYQGPVSYTETAPTSSYSVPPPPPVSQGYPSTGYHQSAPSGAAVSTPQPVYSQAQYQSVWNYGNQTQPPSNPVPNYGQAGYNVNQPPPGYIPNVPPQTGVNTAVPPPPLQQQQQQQQQQPPPQIPPPGPAPQQPYSQPYNQYPPPVQCPPPSSMPPPPINVPPPQVNIPPPPHNMSVPPPNMNKPPPLISKPLPLMGQPPPVQMPPNQPPPQPFPNFPPPSATNQAFNQPPPNFDMMRMPAPTGILPGPQSEAGFASNVPMGLATVRITGRDSSWSAQRRGSHGGGQSSWPEK